MSKESGVSLGIVEVLFLIFVTLKLTGSIDWSWWWVTSPLWIGWGLAFIIFGIIYVATRN